MADYIQQRDAQVAFNQSLIFPNGVGAINGQVHQDNEVGQTLDYYANLWGYDNFSYKVVRNSASDLSNGTALRAAYADAAVSTPGGNALSETNRAAVLIPPGTYNLGDSGLEVDTDYVDLIGLGQPSDVVIVSSSNTATGSGTIIRSASDVILANIRFWNTALTYTGTSSDDSAYAPQNVTPNEKIINCEFYNWDQAPFMRLGVEYAGTYVNCKGIDTGGPVSVMFSNASGTFTDCSYTDVGGISYETATGTFVRCTAYIGFGEGATTTSGTFYDCRALYRGFASGAGGTFSGAAYDCTAQEQSFGFGVGALTTGKMYRCTAASNSFGDTSNTAYLEDCTVEVLGFGPPATAATMSGTYVRCKGGIGSFGVINGSVLDGTFIDCHGGSGSFGSGTSCTLSGNFIRCIGGSNCFGQQSSVVSGTFTDCIAVDASFGYGASSATISTISGTFTRCSGRDDCFGRNSNITSAAVFDHCTGRDRCFGQGANSLSGGHSGSFYHCTGRDACFAAGLTSTIRTTGTFEHCVARNGCFGSGAGSVFAGTARHCTAGDFSFGAAIVNGPGQEPAFEGVAEHCTAGDNSFGASTGDTGGAIFSGVARWCKAGAGSFGSNNSGLGAALFTSGGRAYDCEGGWQSFGSNANGNGGNRGVMVNCKLTTNGVIGVESWLSVFLGRMENCQITVTGTNESALLVGDEARVYGCTLIADGTGDSITSSGTVTAAIAHCRLNAAIAGTVTNSIGTPYNVIDVDIIN